MALPALKSAMVMVLPALLPQTSLADAECEGMLNGSHCDDDAILECKGQVVVRRTTCAFYQDCEKNGGGFGIAACVEDACDDKADGSYCKGDRVVQCQGHQTVNHTECSFYQECSKNGGVLGVAACVEDACDGKADGYSCKGDHVVQCQGQQTVNYTECPFYQECSKKGGGLGVATCVEDACDDKADGSYCKDDRVVQCQGQTTVSFTECPLNQECMKHGGGYKIPACAFDDDLQATGSTSALRLRGAVSMVKTQGTEDECHDEADGLHCEDDGVLACLSRVTVSFHQCPFYQECEKIAGVPTCVEDVCDDKSDGSYCKGDRVVQCQGQQTVNYTECPFYQECSKNGDGLGKAACVEDACDDKADGTYCKDDRVVQCQGQKTVSFTECPLNQECKKHGGGYKIPACTFDNDLQATGSTNALRLRGAVSMVKKQGTEDECHDEADGLHCEDDGVLECLGRVTVSFHKCPFYQECEKIAGVPTCVEDVCDDKADGSYCKGDRVVQCQGQQTVDYTECPFYQECEKIAGVPTCVEDACDDKADGSYCKDDHVVQCQSQKTVSFTDCPLNQECKKHGGGYKIAACAVDDD